jgi:hypothetical protein
MFWPTWPSSGVYDVSLFYIPERKGNKRQQKQRSRFLQEYKKVKHHTLLKMAM